MKKLLCRIAVSVLAVVLLVCSAAPTLAVEQVVTWQGQEKGFGFAPGSEYTATDLFGSFKGIMPGDRLTETITLNNAATDTDYIRLYLRAVPHGEDNAPTASGSGETVATMADFLSQLTMRVYNGETLIYEASPDKTAGLTENVFLSQLSSGDSTTLKAELEVPFALSNRYANCLGEVDWVFTAEQFHTPQSITVKKLWSDNGKNRPTSVTVALYNGDAKVDTVTLSAGNNWTHTWQDLDGLGDWSVKEINIPTGYKATYKTKDGVTTITNRTSLIQTGQLNWPIPVLGGLGLLLVLLGLILVVKERKQDRD